MTPSFSPIAVWRVELLGRLRAVRGERVIDRFRRQKTGVLLAYLAFHRDRPQSRDALIELLWPGCDPAAGRDRLSTSLSSLRRLLELPDVSVRQVITADRSVVALRPEVVTTDVAAFEAALAAAARAPTPPERFDLLAEAVERYAGELLPGYYDDWILPERERLAGEYLQALDALIQHGLETGDPARSLRYARRAVAADPLREESHRTLIRALAAAGEPEAALRQYRELERLLDAELGTLPDPATRALLATLGEGAVQGSEGRSSPRRDVAPSASSPIGTVTLLLTDTARGGREELERRGGQILQETEGALLAAFSRATEALAAAAAVQRASVDERPRIALHTGEVVWERDRGTGTSLDQPIRWLRAAHPGQILLSETTAVLARAEAEPGKSGVALVDLGVYRLWDAAVGAELPERLFLALLPEQAPGEVPTPRAEPFRRGYLPAPLSPFFGREAEIAELRALLDGSQRLVTLTGPGGSGKTRLAVAAGETLMERFRGAVWFVPLAPLTDAQRLADAVLTALNLPRASEQPPLDQVAVSLPYASLLILDNMEQLLPDGALTVRALLERAPQLTCLVTSRQRLGLTGEREFPVAPLPVPEAPASPLPAPGSRLSADGSLDESQEPSAESLAHYPSVALFLDRARAVRPDFQITRSNATTIAAICRKLEGLPLALELAAARTPVLAPAQLLEQLSRRFDVLVTRQRDAAPRHRSLRAAVEWSTQLLSPDLQRLFTELSIFRGGWTLAAGEAVCGAALPDLLDALEQLRDASLVIAEETDAGMRFRMLETLREFAAEQLTPRERTDLAERHARYYRGLAESAGPHLTRGEQGLWLHLLEQEHANLRAALAWSLEEEAATHHERLEIGLRLGAALVPFWQDRGYFSEGREHLARLLTAAERWCGATPAGGGTRLRDAMARAWMGAGTLAIAYGDPEAARPLIEASLAAARASGERSLEATCLLRLGMMARNRGDLAAARRFLEAGVPVQQEVGHSHEVAWSLCYLGDVAREQDELERALALYREARALLQDIGNWKGVGWMHTRLGRVARRQGSLNTAQTCFEEALVLFRKLDLNLGIAATMGLLAETSLRQGDLTRARTQARESLRLYRELANPRDLAWALEIFARVEVDRNPLSAARWLGSVQATRDALHAPPLPHEREANEQLVADLKRRLGDDAFQTAYSTGRETPLPAAVAEALSL